VALPAAGSAASGTLPPATPRAASSAAGPPPMWAACPRACAPRRHLTGRHLIPRLRRRAVVASARASTLLACLPSGRMTSAGGLLGRTSSVVLFTVAHSTPVEVDVQGPSSLPAVPSASAIVSSMQGSSAIAAHEALVEQLRRLHEAQRAVLRARRLATRKLAAWARYTLVEAHVGDLQH
jgi:hypothetical protein